MIMIIILLILLAEMLTICWFQVFKYEDFLFFLWWAFFQFFLTLYRLNNWLIYHENNLQIIQNNDKLQPKQLKLKRASLVFKSLV